MRSPFLLFAPLSLVFALPFTMGAAGDGCAANSQTPAPNVAGAWNITYDDKLNVEVAIGGQTFTSTLGPQGGSFTITYQGTALTFNLDCNKPGVVCPSAAWPKQITATQQDVMFEHRMLMDLPTQVCTGNLVAPAAGTCGPNTLNPTCDKVCDSPVVVQNTERFGVIGADGASFRLYLGAGLATNGINCAMLGYSVADADLVTTGQGTANWQATAFTSGLVTMGYAGGCLWAGDPNAMGPLQAAITGAGIKFTTGFTGTRAGL